MMKAKIQKVRRKIRIKKN